MAAFFICYGLYSIKCESTDFTNLNDLIQKLHFQFLGSYFEILRGQMVFSIKKCAFGSKLRCETAILELFLGFETDLLISA